MQTLKVEHDHLAAHQPGHIHRPAHARRQVQPCTRRLRDRQRGGSAKEFAQVSRRTVPDRTAVSVRQFQDDVSLPGSRAEAIRVAATRGKGGIPQAHLIAEGHGQAMVRLNIEVDVISGGPPELFLVHSRVLGHLGGVTQRALHLVGNHRVAVQRVVPSPLRPVFRLLRSFRLFRLQPCLPLPNSPSAARLLLTSLRSVRPGRPCVPSPPRGHTAVTRCG